MAMVVKNNMQAKNTLNQLNRNVKATGKNLEKLSSGMKINSAADDASGLSIAEKMDVRLRGLEQDNANTQNGSSLLKVAEGALDSTVDILKSMTERVINAANDTNSDADRAIIQKEIDQAIDQLDDNANVTYNGKQLLDGSKNDSVIAGGTYTHLTNQSFANGVTDETKFTALKARTGDNLGILVGDTITVSYVKEGETHTKSFTVSKSLEFNAVFDWDPCNEDMELTSYSDHSKIGEDQFGNEVFTADRGEAVTYKAKKSGLDGQISGLTICVSDRYGKPKKSANAVLDNFNETIRAQNESPDNSMVFQIGTKANESIKVGFTDMRSVALGLKTATGKTLNVSTQVDANAAINVLDTALQKVLDQQTKIGSVESRLGFTSSNLTIAAENTQSSMSVIRDADMAKEMANYTKNNVLTQASQSMLAQANQNSSSVLSLLQ